MESSTDLKPDWVLNILVFSVFLPKVVQAAQPFSKIYQNIIAGSVEMGWLVRRLR